MLVLGPVDERDPPRLSELRAALENCGMSSPRPDDIRQSVWAKLVQNLSTAALSTLTGATVAEVRKNEHLKNLAARLGAEGKAIARAHGIDPEGAPQRPGGGQSAGGIHHKPSLLQDYERGRPMEVDALLVAALEFARAARVPVPALEAIVPLVVFKATVKGLYED
jgi:2-dehydropantoate 2-reductase